MSVGALYKLRDQAQIDVDDRSLRNLRITWDSEVAFELSTLKTACGFFDEVLYERELGDIRSFWFLRD